MPTNDPRPTKAQRRDDAREKARQMRIEQERKAKRTRIVAISALAVALVALVGVGAYIFKQDADNKATYANVMFAGGSSDAVIPALADTKAPSTASGAYIPVSKDGVGKAAASGVTLSIYYDLQCPICAQFDSINAADLDALAAEDGVTIKYFPVSFLDQQSLGTHYSMRAANAAAIVADKDSANYPKFLTALFAQQPAENTNGLTDDKIAEIAQGVGVPSSVTDTFTDTVDGTYKLTGSDTEQKGTWRTYAPWMESTTNEMQTVIGKVSTPTVLIDDKAFTGWQTPGALKAAVEAAKS
ncbi:thioredoxin domain-containing protein [Cellulomonas sp. HZM]|uniref:DsbA family protein n=1 Tax=Cellulomonas sp. HZM TaxID=1454010 RepID=UPI00049382E1|nr:thioredoxin domain-containing protein [Cellulomonas sp. HZM]